MTQMQLTITLQPCPQAASQPHTHLYLMPYISCKGNPRKRQLPDRRLQSRFYLRQNLTISLPPYPHCWHYRLCVRTVCFSLFCLHTQNSAWHIGCSQEVLIEIKTNIVKDCNQAYIPSCSLKLFPSWSSNKQWLLILNVWCTSQKKKRAGSVSPTC